MVKYEDSRGTPQTMELPYEYKLDDVGVHYMVGDKVYSIPWSRVYYVETEFTPEEAAEIRRSWLT